MCDCDPSSPKHGDRSGRSIKPAPPRDQLAGDDVERAGEGDAEQRADDAAELCARRDADCDREWGELHRAVIDELLEQIVLELLEYAVLDAVLARKDADVLAAAS